MKNTNFLEDYRIAYGTNFTPGGYLRILRNHGLRYLYLGRVLEETNNKLLIEMCKFFLRSIYKRTGIEIDFSQKRIGLGLQLVHHFNIVVNYRQF